MFIKITPKIALSLVTMLATVLLSACISTTTGPYTDEADAGKALDRRVALARQYIGDGNWEGAKRNLQLAQKIEPNSAEVHEAFGLVYQRTGEFELAEENFKDAVRLDRSCSRCRNNYAAFLFTQERYEEAEAQLTVVVKDSLYSARPNAFVNLGLCRQKLFDPQGAEEAYVRALTMDRTNRIALRELSVIRFEAGDYDTANQYYDILRQVVRQQSASELWLGIRLAQATGSADAEASYALALSSRFPASPEYQAYLRTQSAGE